MPDYRSLYDRDYIGHFDLPGGKDMTLTITRVVGGELTAIGGRKSKKPIVHFAGSIKPLICNKTNGKTIAGMYGNEVREWVGKRITLFVSMTRNPDGGGEIECIRIRPNVPVGKDTPTAPQPEPEEQIIETPKAAAAQAVQASLPSSGDAPAPLAAPEQRTAAARVADGVAAIPSADEVTAKEQSAAAPSRTIDKEIELRDRANSLKVNKGAFLELFKVASFEKLAAEHYAAASAWLDKKEAAK